MHKRERYVLLIFHCCVSFFVECRIICLCVNFAAKSSSTAAVYVVQQLFYDDGLVKRAAHQTVLSVACNSDPGIL